MTKSLYEKVGGFKAVRKVVSDFYDRVLENDELNHHFVNVEMAKLIDHQTKFFAMLLGGPASYTDEQLQHIHKGMGITERQYMLICELVVETLEDHDWPEADTQSVHSLLLARKESVVEVK